MRKLNTLPLISLKRNENLNTLRWPQANYVAWVHMSLVFRYVKLRAALVISTAPSNAYTKDLWS